MVKWHETPIANLALRFGGIGMLSLGWATGAFLCHHVHARPASQASVGELGLCMLLVVCTLGGAVLLMVGPGLWKQVRAPGRGAFNLADDLPSNLLDRPKATNDNLPAGAIGADARVRGQAGL